MQNYDALTHKTGEMSAAALKMLQTTFQAFMEHDTDLIAEALIIEEQLNTGEKELTQGFAEAARAAESARLRLNALAYAQVVADLELIGDYCKDICERVEIKIGEHLLFSDDAVSEYLKLYRITEQALKEIVTALTHQELGLVSSVLKGQRHIDELVDEFRAHHAERLVAGVCSALAGNMFLNMLDYTAAIYYHIKKIARQILTVQS